LISNRKKSEEGLEDDGISRNGTSDMTARDLVPFFRAWVSNPLGVGAVAPSGSALGDAITAEITAASAPVIELGLGTGVFARSLIARGVPEEKLVLVEYGSDFVRLRQYRFPAARILWIVRALANLPPAGIYRLRRRRGTQLGVRSRGTPGHRSAA
jgi:hypothetical protein